MTNKPCCHYYFWNAARWASFLSDGDLPSLRHWVSIADRNFHDYSGSTDQEAIEPKLCVRCRETRALVAEPGRVHRAAEEIPPLEDASQT